MELRDRLRTAFGTRSQTYATRPRTRAETDLRRLGMQRRDTPAGAVFVAEQRWPLPHRHGDYRLGEALVLSAAARQRLLPDATCDSLHDAAFVDVETTGLSGGTGTLVFLVGIGAFEAERFVLRQYFLADVGSEAAMLRSVVELLDGRPALVSFNGRRFDLPLLLTRLALMRIEPPVLGDHLDLLYPSRRLYRTRLRSCALATLEASVLGLQRSGDVGGYLAPAIYLDYVRTGSSRGLIGVVEHNAHDILSLVSLLSHLGRVLAGADADADDCLALGHWDGVAGRTTSAIALFAEALATAKTPAQQSTARLRLARLHKRAGKVDQAIPLWREEADGGAPAGRLEALVELAKVSEHQVRDFYAAASLTERALTVCEDVGAVLGSRRSHLGRPALEHRLRRLARRMAAATNG